MSSFTTPLRVEAIDDTDWKILETFQYRLGSVDSKQYVSVPAGYVTDFATVPRILWGAIPPWGSYGKACVIHDFLCTDGYYWAEVEGIPTKVMVDRREAADIFLEAMNVLGVDPITSGAMYGAVRAYAFVTGKE